MFLLNESHPKQTYCVLDCPIHPRLQALGLKRDCCFTCVSHTAFKGPVIVEINHRQLAIDYQLAKQITVKDWVDHAMS